MDARIAHSSQQRRWLVAQSWQQNCYGATTYPGTSYEFVQATDLLLPYERFFISEGTQTPDEILVIS